MAFVPADVEVKLTLDTGGFVIIPATSVSANYGEAEVVDVTNITTPLGEKAFIPTGDLKSYGSLSITANKEKNWSYGPYRGSSGTLSLASQEQGWSISYKVYVTTVSETHEAGGLAKNTINFAVWK
jgi:hypothetical protein